VVGQYNTKSYEKARTIIGCRDPVKGGREGTEALSSINGGKPLDLVVDFEEAFQ